MQLCMDSFYWGSTPHGRPKYVIRGYGPVDGLPSDLSLARGELHGQTALAIMAEKLLTSTACTDHPIKLIGDNKGIQEKKAYCKHNKLNHHRNANVDLYPEYEKAANQLHCTVTWVQSYQDHDTPWENIT
jgi:hypothetical protein